MGAGDVRSAEAGGFRAGVAVGTRLIVAEVAGLGIVVRIVWVVGVIVIVTRFLGVVVVWEAVAVVVVRLRSSKSV